MNPLISHCSQAKPYYPVDYSSETMHSKKQTIKLLQVLKEVDDNQDLTMLISVNRL